MKEIPVRHKGEVVSYALVSDEDYGFLSQFRWTLHTMGYAQTAKRIDGKSVKFYMHRMILPIDTPIDHVDGNKMNNQRSNLRSCNVSNNAANSKSRSGSSSRHKGVSLSRGKWMAMIEKDGRSYFLGRHINEEEAARAYDRKALELFGEFARTNFPKDEYKDVEENESKN